MGRATARQQQFWANNAWSGPYRTSATYDLAGALVTQTYPSNHSVTYESDQVGRTKSLVGNLGDGVTRTYADNFQYNEFGGLQQEQFGTATPLYHKQRYNSRGQIWDIKLSTVSFSSDPANGDRGSIINYYSSNYSQGGSGTDNNGTLLRQESRAANGTYFQQTYAYDNLNRLTSVYEKLNGTGADSFKQVYTYDRWGNRSVDQNLTTSNVPHPNYTIDTSTNRLIAPSGYSYGYDSAGNQTNDTYTGGTGGGQRIYDAENRLISAQENSAWHYYKYSSSGLRVRRLVNGSEDWVVYGIDGKLVAEYPYNGTPASPQREYGYRNGQLLIVATAGTSSSSTENVTWTSAVGVTANGNSLVRVSGGFFGGAASSQAIASGDGYVEFTATETNKIRWCGLSNGNSNVFSDDIDFAVSLGGGAQVQILEGGAYKASIDYTGGDRFRVAVTGGVVTYSKNGSVFYTSATVPTYPLLVDTTLYNAGGTITNAVISGNLGGGSGGGAELKWLIADQQGSTRMMVDQTGSLASVKRQDYLPFGEQIGSAQVGLIGGRDTTPGYVSDTVRQKFTGYEADAETGLNFAQARYHSSVQGRFTSVDPLGSSADVTDPQSLNRYSYVGNSPTNFTDPTGLKAGLTYYYREADLAWRDVAGSFWGRPDISTSGRRDVGWAHVARGMLRHAELGNTRWTEPADCDVTVSATVTGPATEGEWNAAVPAETPQIYTGRILIVYGEPGISSNAGNVFPRAAETKRRQFESAGFEVIVVDAHSPTDLINAFNNNGSLDAFEYVGHASGQWLGVANARGLNFQISDVRSLSRNVLNALAYVKLNACFAAAGGWTSIAGALANHLDRTVWAMNGGTVFSSNERTLTTVQHNSRNVYVIEDVGTRLLPFTRPH